MSLDIRPGEVIGIVGPSGSGKSTLTKLVQRFHAPSSGDILVDGIDIAQVDPTWLRRQLGVVLQENFLFNQTVHENIALAKPATSALDYESERIIRHNMHQIARGRTVIVIAHRLAAVRNCDRIVGLSKGEIVEIGTHEDLVGRRNGLYARLWSLQTDQVNA